MRFRPASGVQRRLRQNLAALLFGVGLTVAVMPVAQAQTWGGTTSTGDYNTNTEWTPATAPTAAGQTATFDAAGSSTVDISAGISPDSWTFNAGSQSYSIGSSTFSGVTFSLAGAGGGTGPAARSVGLPRSVSAAIGLSPPFWRS